MVIFLRIVLGCSSFFFFISPSFSILSCILYLSLSVAKYLLTLDFVIFSKKYPKTLGYMSIIIAFILCWWFIMCSFVISFVLCLKVCCFWFFSLFLNLDLESVNDCWNLSWCSSFRLIPTPNFEIEFTSGPFLNGGILFWRALLDGPRAFQRGWNSILKLIALFLYTFSS